MKHIISIVSLLFIVGFIHAQPRLSIKHQLQKCLDGSGNPIPNCRVFTDSLGRQFYATVQDGIDTLLLYGLRDTIIAYGGGGAAITVGPQDQIPFPNLGSTDFDYDADLLFQDSVLYVETTTNHPDQPALHVVRNMGDTAAFPLTTVLIENTTDIDDDTNEYQNEVRLVLKAGGPTTGTAERYIEWDKYDGTVDHLFGVNGQGNKISFDSDNFQHREWYEEFGHTFLGSDNDQPFYINFVETFGVPMGPEPSEAPGTGGFIVGDGGVSPKRLFQVGVSDNDTELFKANGTDKWLIFDESSNAIQLFDGIINVNNFGSATHSLINFFRDDTQLAGSFFYNQSSELRFFHGIGSGDNADYHIFRYIDASSLQDLPLTIKNSNGQFNLGSYPISGSPTHIFAKEADDDMITMTFEELADSLAGLNPTDSVFSMGDLICIVTESMDTICADTAFYDDVEGTFCVVDMGDTTCVEFDPVGVTWYTGNSSFTSNRTAFHNGKWLQFSQAGMDGTRRTLQIHPDTTESTLKVWNKPRNDSPALEILGTQHQSYDYWQFFNGVSAAGLQRDYGIGVDQSEAAFRFSETNLFNDFYLSYYGDEDSLIVHKGIKLDGKVWDEDGDVGTTGDVLTKQADGTVDWAAAASGADGNGLFDVANDGGTIPNNMNATITGTLELGAQVDILETSATFGDASGAINVGTTPPVWVTGSNAEVLHIDGSAAGGNYIRFDGSAEDWRIGNIATGASFTIGTPNVSTPFRINDASPDEALVIKDDGSINLGQYDGTPPTGTEFGILAHESDGDIISVDPSSLGGSYTDEQAQDAVGAMIDASLNYVDATPLLQRASLTGAITASAGSNATVLGSFTTADLNTAVSDNDVATLAGAETLTNKSIALGSNTVTGTTAQFNTANTDADFVVLVAAGQPAQTFTNSIATDQDYTSLYTIPTNYLTSGKQIEVSIGWQSGTGGVTTTVISYLKIGNIKVYISGADDLGNSLTRGGGQTFLISGTAAAGASVAVYTTQTAPHSLLSQSNYRNTVSYTQNLATDGNLPITPGITYSANGGTESMTLVNFTVKLLN